MKLSKLFIPFFSFLLLQCPAKSQRSDSVDYIIYRTILKTSIPENRKSVAVFNMTSRVEYHDPWYGDTTNRTQLISGWMRIFRTPFDSGAYALYRQFDRKHMRSERVTNSFQLPIDVFLIKKSSFEKLFKKSVEKGWSKFYEHYPNSAGIFEFSDVHYSEDGTKAVVYYSVHRNGLNGGGFLLILEEVDGQWRTIHEASLWAN